MNIKVILSHFEPDLARHEPHHLNQVMALAEAFSADVTALSFATDVGAPAAGGMQAGSPDPELALAMRIESAASRRGVTCTVIGRSSFAYGFPDVFADHAKLSDICVLGHGPNPSTAQRMLAASAIFASGRPALLLPHDTGWAGLPQRIFLAWDASPAAVRAMHNALPFILRGAETFVVSVTDDKEWRGGQSGIEVAHLLARHGARVSFMPIRKGRLSVLEALQQAMSDPQADLLVMGCIGHSPWHQLVFGSVTGDLLRGHASRVVLTSA